MLPSALIKFKCCAPGCQSVYMPGCEESFFAFPKEPSRCQKWIHFCGLEDRYRVAKEVPRTLKLCSKHFNKSEYYKSRAKRYLLGIAVPSIHSNGTLMVQETSKPYHQAPSLTSCSTPKQRKVVRSLSPLHSLLHQHKVLRTYARKARLTSSTASSGGKTSFTSQQVSSPRDFKMELKDGDALKMNLKEEPLWLDQICSKNKSMAEGHCDKDAELKNKIMSLSSVFTMKFENNIEIYNLDHEMNVKIEIKDEPIADTDLYEQTQDTDLWANRNDEDCAPTEPPR